jgi:lysosomal alpha-glucosidase
MYFSFDTSIAPLIYANQFIQFSSYLPNGYVYGIGEHRDSFQHVTDWKRYTIWTAGIPPFKGINLYGAHPFYMTMDENNNAMGFFLMNSNAMGKDSLRMEIHI